MSERRQRIGVLIGGSQPAREVSLRSGQAVLEALGERGYDAVPLYVDRDLDLGLRQERIDVAFIALHGRGADGPVQGLCESLSIPYTGSSLLGAALGTDKLKTKELLRLHNLPTPAYYRVVRGAAPVATQHNGFGFPCVVKPRSGGVGIGVTLVRDVDELEAAVEVALRFDDEALVERFVAGREVQVALLDGEILGVAELASDRGILDYATRHVRGRVQVMVPPRLSAERLRGVVTQALRAHQLIGCDGATRIDLVVSERENESLLEVEPFPELGRDAVVPRLAASAGLGYVDLVERILAGARLHSNRRLRERRQTIEPWLGSDRRAAAAGESH